MDLRVTTLEPRLSAASYPPLRQAQGRLLHKTQGRGTHYVGDVGAIKAQGHPAGTGVVIGSYRDYLDKAEEMGADALNVPKSRYDFFNSAGEFETLNRAYLNANAFLNQDFYMSNAPEGVA